MFHGKACRGTDGYRSNQRSPAGLGICKAEARVTYQLVWLQRVVEQRRPVSLHAWSIVPRGRPPPVPLRSSEPPVGASRAIQKKPSAITLFKLQPNRPVFILSWSHLHIQGTCVTPMPCDPLIYPLPPVTFTSLLLAVARHGSLFASRRHRHQGCLRVLHLTSYP